jgi:heme/copper-type cytochrome/quinol oxidase subunit 4
MCIGDDPVARAMPYLISGIISVVITLLLFTIPFVKKWNPKYTKLAKIVLIIISVILLFLAFVQYTTRYKCI